MGYMLIGIVTAFYAGAMLYAASGSMFLTFLVYSLTGMLVMISALATDAVFGVGPDNL